MDSDPIEISFAKNGKYLGIAYKIQKSTIGNRALFPHILTKNSSFTFNFGHTVMKIGSYGFEDANWKFNKFLDIFLTERGVSRLCLHQ